MCKKDKHVTKATRVELCSCWLLRENITLSSVCVCVIQKKNISYCIWMQSSISQRSHQSVVLLVTVQMLWEWGSILFNLPIGNISFGCHLHAWKKDWFGQVRRKHKHKYTNSLFFRCVFMCVLFAYIEKCSFLAQGKKTTTNERDRDGWRVEKKKVKGRWF